MENKTYYDEVRATVRKGHNQWHWVIRSADGQKMAAGEEFSLKVAYQEAWTAVSALRTWSVFSRGSVAPSTDGRRWFSFENTESSRNFEAMLVPSRKQLNKLTKNIKKGKVKK